MLIPTEGESRQIRVVKFITYIGIFFYVASLTPIVCYEYPLLHDGIAKRFMPHDFSRTAQLASCFPLIFDCFYETSLPHRLTYPRFILIVSMFLSNAVSLVLTLAGLNNEGVQVALTVGSFHLFTCALAAYIAGEVVNKKLLNYLTVVAIISSFMHTYLSFRLRFSPIILPDDPFRVSTMLLRLSLFVVLIWFMFDMKALEERRKAFANIYALAFAIYLIAPIIGYLILLTNSMTSYNSDMVCLLQAVIGSFAAIIPSRMAQYDAAMIIVSDLTNSVTCIIN